MSYKKRVLFVDDDPDFLSGMKQMLRSMRNLFTMEVASSGMEALEIMAEHPCDIVISDMQMPGMDGAELLSTIKEQHPNTIRLMLTGRTDDESVLRTVGIAHQFLAKPYESANLKRVLLRVSVLHNLLSDEQLKSIISSIDSLPSLPATYAKLQKIITNPESSISDVGALIEQDLAMSAKILQLVNSAFFGLYKHVDSPSRAVNLLGLDTIKALVLGVQVFSELKTKSELLSMDDLFSHSMKVGTLAHKIALAMDVEKQVADDCFIAGILHDVGKLLFLANMPEVYEQALAAVGPKLNLHDAEKQILHADHGGVVGAYLIGLWGLPGPVVEAICFHHRLAEYPEDIFSPALAVHLADVLCHELEPGQCVGAPPMINEEVVTAVGLTEKMEELRSIAKDVIGRPDRAT